MLSPTANNSNSFFPTINEATPRNFGTTVNRNSSINRKISNPLQSDNSSSNNGSSNLNLTLLSRPYFFEFIKHGTKLETKIRRIKARNWNATEVTEEMTNFFSSICEEFQKSNDVITLFLDGLDQMFKLLASIVDSFSTLDVADSIIGDVKAFKDSLMGDSGDESTSVLQQTKRALQSIKLASEMCQTTTSDLTRAVELTSLCQYTDSDVVDLQKECKHTDQILAREISNLERLCVDAHEKTQEAKEYIDDHKWKDHETVRQEIIMSKIKVRDSKNSTDRALKARTDASDMQETLKRAVSELIKARPTERSDKFEEVQEQLEKVRSAEQKLREQYKETNECLEAVGKAALSLKQLNPSDQWPMLRVPLKSTSHLICLLRGPREVIAHVKVSYKRKGSYLRNILNTGDEALTDIIELDNHATHNPRWPLLVCLPQKRQIDENEVRSVIFKTSTDQHGRMWTSDQPIRVNQEYFHKRHNLKGFLFTEAKIHSFSSMAVVLSGMRREQTGLSSIPGTPRGNTEVQLFDRIYKYRKREKDLVLDDIFVYELLSRFNEDWKKIFIYLEVPINIIKNKEMEHPSSKLDVMLSCMNYWKNTKTSCVNRIDQMKEAMKKCKRQDLFEMIDEKQREIKKLYEQVPVSREGTSFHMNEN